MRVVCGAFAGFLVGLAVVEAIIWGVPVHDYTVAFALGFVGGNLGATVGAFVGVMTDA